MNLFCAKSDIYQWLAEMQSENKIKWRGKNDQCGNMEMHDNWFTDWKPFCMTLFCNLFQYLMIACTYITLSCFCYKLMQQQNILIYQVPQFHFNKWML